MNTLGIAVCRGPRRRGTRLVRDREPRAGVSARGAPGARLLPRSGLVAARSRRPPRDVAGGGRVPVRAAACRELRGPRRRHRRAQRSLPGRHAGPVVGCRLDPGERGPDADAPGLGGPPRTDRRGRLVDPQVRGRPLRGAPRPARGVGRGAGRAPRGGRGRIRRPRRPSRTNSAAASRRPSGGRRGARSRHRIRTARRSHRLRTPSRPRRPRARARP